MFLPAAESSFPGGKAALLCVAEVSRRPRWRFPLRGLPGVVSNRDHFWRAVDAVTANDATAVRLGQRIERKQRLLQSMVGERGWRVYVDIEELQVQRTLRWIELVATSARRRSPRRGPKSR
jgi:hypothetical protein